MTHVHSGKSTQVPQFLAEELLQGKHNYGSVICTQVHMIQVQIHMILTNHNNSLEEFQPCPLPNVFPLKWVTTQDPLVPRMA